MAKVTNLQILNGADKSRHYAYAIGKGAISENTDPIVTDVHSFQIGSQYVDQTNKKLYVRVAAAGNNVSDWVCVNPDAE